ncbi:NAD(P)H-binding protein [Candidatus Micrarchaeota archaeon]|nr:NAD(P)H-binding protein [Candidatus Micrarchaeota archaeon]
MRIVIFGAGRVGIALAKTLEERKHQVAMVDRSREMCDEVAAETNVNVVCGEATDPELLGELKLDNADFVFAVTGNEETNFLVSVYAKHVNADRVVSRASDPKYSNLMQRLGVEPIIPEVTLTRELANKVLSPLITMMLDPSDSKIEMLEKDVDSSMKGKEVAKVNEEKDFTIISVYENGSFLFPSSDFKLKEGMKIVVVKHNV